MIRVLVVDDSSTMRRLISAALSADPELTVVGEAGDPLEAREAIKALNPDVITLDVEMPNMNGLDFLERLMRLRPMPVVMVSTLTARGAEATLHALELGAIECVEKPGGADPTGFGRLAEKVKIAARARVRQRAARAEPVATDIFTPSDKVVAIGSSTGGVEALLTIIERLSANCAPTVIAQHMPASFTKSFAERLNRTSAATVSEACDGDPLIPGRVYVAPGGDFHLEVEGTRHLRCRVSHGDPVSGHCPSVDVLFSSVARCAKDHAVGVILTGMGRDGARGLLSMREAGARTLGQDEATSVVYGMPRAAFELGAVERQLPLEKLGPAIRNLTNKETER
ncbi:MAG: chemotaxis response regulator protein-glutamate methylesterase [Alphaproteobacteria bacterium]|nr:chemotaxis response regulator protein-glutamate methylesterase [Alphaproteobacteria bacterium]MBU1515840.1 chemotaxis response regulator protein-glutamate methylesterase [Alphaproteobacteria bacterium]MBU2094062.1 chemotaxis response regulator protein-glutamate methylesterase [Alphaproteobacteria bacterium]MBU2151414.1 chemotaxis response regulator protein-glutamate methylesterase [Alphaproteobacteria bacterium]MBU2305310.1 chemotaxis response regulator protein-glutamate methylesterase [Alph